MREEISSQLSSFVLTIQQTAVWVCVSCVAPFVCLLLCSKTTHLASVPVDQVEDGVILRLPGHDFMKALSLDPVQHELQQVQLDRLLDEHDVVLRHDWRGRAYTGGNVCIQNPHD